MNSEKVCEKLLENCEFKKEEILNIEEKGGYYLLNNKIETENIILATGWEEILKIPYIKIRPVWGQRIEIETDISLQNHTHKNCSVSKNENGIVKIGATHERIWEDKAPNQVSAQILIDKANEITKLTNYKIYSMKSGMRAGSVDYFPIIGEVIDTEKTLQLYPEVKKGRIPKEVIYKKGIFVINGGGGRGFSNYVYSAKILSEAILNNKIILFKNKVKSYTNFFNLNLVSIDYNEVTIGTEKGGEGEEAKENKEKISSINDEKWHLR